SNPLLLTLMVLLDYSGKKKLPSSKPELIKMVIEESMTRRKELSQLKQKEAFQSLLTTVSVCLNKGESIKNTRRKLSKKAECCGIDSVDDYSSLIALFEKVGLVFANSSGQLSFVHRCFNEYLYAKYLFDSEDDSNSDEMLKYAIEQEFSEVFFYYCSFHKNVSGILGKLLAKGNSEIERCVEILAFEKINASIKTSRLAMSLFRIRIKDIWRNDIELFSKVFLQYKLDMLRLSNPLVSKPLKYREATSFFKLDKVRHNRRNSLVGLSNKEVRELFNRINQTYSDYRGSFSLPTIRMMTPDSADDTVIRFKNHFRVYREKSKRFTRIRQKVETHANQWYERIHLSHEDAFRDVGISEKIKKMVEAVLKEWNPNLLLLPETAVRKANQKYVDEEFDKRSYALLRNELVGDTYQRAHQVVSSKIIKSIFGEGNYDEISKLYQQVYIMNSDQLLDFRRLTAADIDPLIKGATVRFINSLQSSGVYNEFKKVSFLLSRLYTLSAILAGDVEPWGRLRIMFIAKVDGDEL
ncbi:MAG: hypothetical protein OQJ89_06995, partial [Kangiellaceae bacterium]|nr:hypothetical protein [Kangiellaceae bacterium]